MKTKQIRWGSLLAQLALSLGVGGASAWLTGRQSKELYSTLNQPPLAPPSWVFPLVWTVLFLLMAVSAYLVWPKADGKTKALYLGQLAVNFFWSILFFRGEFYGLAFLWLLLLWVLIFWMVQRFYEIDPRAARLQLPYLFWVAFAGYLNLGIYLLNR